MDHQLKNISTELSHMILVHVERRGGGAVFEPLKWWMSCILPKADTCLRNVLPILLSMGQLLKLGTRPDWVGCAAAIGPTLLCVLLQTVKTKSYACCEGWLLSALLLTWVSKKKGSVPSLVGFIPDLWALSEQGMHRKSIDLPRKRTDARALLNHTMSTYPHSAFCFQSWLAWWSLEVLYGYYIFFSMKLRLVIFSIRLVHWLAWSYVVWFVSKWQDRCQGSFWPQMTMWEQLC